MEQSLLRQRFGELREAASAIRPMSTAAEEILNVSSSSRGSLKDLARVVQTDAALAARLMRLANSSFFGLSRQISTLPDAIVLVGLKGVRNLAVSTSVSAMASRLPSNSWVRERTREINDHCLATAIAARRFGVAIQRDVADELFLAGLIHDLGRVVLMFAYPDAYKRIWEQAATHGTNPALLERDFLGVDHVAAIDVVGRDWNLPSTLLELVTAHHRPAFQTNCGWPNGVVNLLQAGNALAKVARLGNSGDPRIEIEPFCRLLAHGWDPDRLSNEAELLVQEMRELQGILGATDDAAATAPPPTVYQDFFRVTARACNSDGTCSIGAAS